MRILRQETPKIREYKITCWHCKSELAVTRKDTLCGQWNEPVVECPVCSHYIDWNESEMEFIGFVNEDSKEE